MEYRLVAENVKKKIGINAMPRKQAENAGFSGRLREKLPRGAQVRVASALGVDVTTVNRWAKGMVPEADTLVRLALHLGTTAEYLLTGHDPPARLSPDELPQPRVIFSSALDQAAAAEAGVRVEDYRAVPLVEDAVAAGAARVVSDQVTGWAWVFGPLLGKRSNLVAVRVKGDSMAPALPDGSVAVVDRGDRRLVRGAVYVVRIDSAVTVKYVAREGNDLVLIPENREHREQHITIREGDADPIVGRVVWSWRVWV